MPATAAKEKLAVHGGTKAVPDPPVERVGELA